MTDQLRANESGGERVYGSFARGVALTFATRLLMLVGVVGSSVIVARWLGPEGLGTLAVLTVTVLLALSIGNLGLASANTYFVSRDRGNLGPVWANTIVFAFTMGSLLIAVVAALAVIRPQLFGGVATRLLFVAAVSIPFQILTLLGINILLAMDRIRHLNVMDALSPALLLINAIVVVIIWRGNLPLLVSFNTITAVALSIVMVWVIARVLADQPGGSRARPDARLFRATISYGFRFAVPVMAAILIFRIDLLIVNRFRGPAEAGVYAVASQVANLLLMLPGVIATLLFPRVASGQDERGEFAVRVTRYASFVMLITCLAAATGSFMLPFIYGPRFADATIQLLILLPGVFLVGIESVLVQHFNGTGMPGAITVFWLITLALNLGLNLMLVPGFGARGAAVTSTISYTLIFGFVAGYFCLKTKRRPAEIFWLGLSEIRELLASGRLALGQPNVHQ